MNSSTTNSPTVDDDSWDIKTLSAYLILFRQIFTKTLIPIICIVGIISNILNLIVLARPRMRSSSTNTYLFVLAIYDLTYAALMLLLVPCAFEGMEKEQYCNLGKRLFMFGCNLSAHNTAWLTCAFTIERYVATTFPMRARNFCTRRLSRWIISSIFVFCLLITMPEIFVIVASSKNQRHANTTANETLIGSSEDQKLKNTTTTTTTEAMFNFFHSTKWNLIVTVLVVLLPLVVLVVFNGLLIRSVVKASHQRRHLSVYKHSGRKSKLASLRNSDEKSIVYTRTGSRATNPTHSRSNDRCGTNNNEITRLRVEGYRLETSNSIESDEGPSRCCLACSRFTGPLRCLNSMSERNRITIMLIAVVIAYCLFNLPSVVLKLIGGTDDKKGKIKRQIAGNVVNTSLVLNSALNFFFYSGLSKQFRKTLLTVFACNRTNARRSYRSSTVPSLMM